MSEFTYVGAGGRDYFPAEIGHVEPGDVRDLEQAPDVWWEPTTPAVPPATLSAKAPAAPAGSAAPAGDSPAAQ